MSTSLEFISLRLKIARLRHGDFPRAADAIRVLEERLDVKDRTYRSYERGEKTPPPETVANIERLYKVKPPGWILFGGGESLATLREMLKGLQQKARERGVSEDEAGEEYRGTLISFPNGQVSAPVSAPVNQLTPKSDEHPSHNAPYRRMRVLSADEIAPYLAGEALSTMPGQMLPMPPDLNADRAFPYQLPANDFSMIGDKITIPPLTMIIIDPDQDVLPNNLLLARPVGARGWLLRRYEASLPLSVATEFELHAANPSVKPVRIMDKARWEIAGRMIYTLQRW